MLTKRTSSLPNVRGPVMQQFAIDDAIVRVGLFFICFITVGVFYMAVTKLPVRNAVPVQQLQQAGSLFNRATNSPAVSVQPLALGAADASLSASPSASAWASAAPSAAVAAVPTALPPSPAATSPSASPAAAVRKPPSPSPKPSAKPSASPSGQSYTVQKGDTLTKIARRFDTSVTALESANGGSAEIKIGQKLTIP